MNLKQARFRKHNFLVKRKEKNSFFKRKEIRNGYVRVYKHVQLKSKDRLQRFEELSKVKDVEVNGKVENDSYVLSSW